MDLNDLRSRKKLLSAALVVFALALPPIGIACSDQTFTTFFEFPPTQSAFFPIEKSSLIFWTSIALVLLCSAGILRLRCLSGTSKISRRINHHISMRGWFGLLLLSCGWLTAWTSFAALQVLRPYAFLPLWCGYVLFVDAVYEVQSAKRLHWSTWAQLSLISMVVWWCFEYLNQFTRNWGYQNLENFSALEYIFISSLSFCTVLPALSVTKCALDGYFAVDVNEKPTTASLEWIDHKRSKVSAIIISSLALFFLGWWPNQLFPFVWLSPLFIAIVIESELSADSLLSQAARGKWREIVTWALSGLACGFLWELWNFYSFTRWVYNVPYVGQAKIFEMPLLGFLGYLPFGVFSGILIRSLYIHTDAG